VQHVKSKAKEVALMSLASQGSQPQGTRDIDQARSELAEFGYCLVEDALSPDRVESLRARVLEQAAAEEEAGVGCFDQGPGQVTTGADGRLDRSATLPGRGGVNQRVQTLLNKGQVFCDLVVNPVILDMVSYWLGESFLLSTTNANIANPGGTPMRLHSDQWWMPPPARRTEQHLRPGSMRRGQGYGPRSTGREDLIAPPVGINAMVFLVDIDDDMGGTRLVPGSHLGGVLPDPGQPDPAGTVHATGEAGTICFFDARLFHGTGANRSDRPRIVLLNYYTAPQFRPQQNYVVALRKEVREKASPQLLRLLGFEPWEGYGALETEAESILEFLAGRESLIGEMRT
jgi:ectoine hydroxylase-related dioxygenase (phytanoyl-CoA dioxygenase family)